MISNFNIQNFYKRVPCFARPWYLDHNTSMPLWQFTVIAILLLLLPYNIVPFLIKHEMAETAMIMAVAPIAITPSTLPRITPRVELSSVYT